MWFPAPGNLPRLFAIAGFLESDHLRRHKIIKGRLEFQTTLLYLARMSQLYRNKMLLLPTIACRLRRISPE